MPRIIIVIPTFYSDANDIRFPLALDTCRAIASVAAAAAAADEKTIQMEGLIVDASPSDAIRDALTKAGTHLDTQKSYLTVVKQTCTGRKGAALREGIVLAAAKFKDTAVPNPSSSCYIAFQEPEKVDMIAHWKSTIESMERDQSDICVPYRNDTSFRSTYPMEQYHSEQFANLYLDALAAKHCGSSKFPSKIDWTMGPIALRSTMVGYWEAFRGDLWDMQLVPMVQAARDAHANITSHTVDYQHPVSMKEQELGEPVWSEKRLFQLNFLFEHVGGALKGETKSDENASAS